MIRENSAILLISCPDQQGIVHAVTEFILKHKGNVIDLEQHVDNEYFFMRLELDLEEVRVSKNEFEIKFSQQVAENYQMTYWIHYSSKIPRMAIFVSKTSHCLFDILSRYHSKQWPVEIPLVVSNHEDLREVVENQGIDFYFTDIHSKNKIAAEAEQLRILKEKEIDFIVLARYMQILSSDFVTHYPNNIINIHHSFLPAFAGAKPYHHAYRRGVKIIGATSHYVTADLDAGPIIEQDVAHVRHTDMVQDLVRKGQDIEKVVLSRAIWHHLHHSILVHENRTIVFD